MSKEEIKIKVVRIFKEVFSNDELEIKEETTSEDICEWDSLIHIQIIVTIEKVFNIKFKMQELLNQKNVGDLVDAIYKKINI